MKNESNKDQSYLDVAKIFFVPGYEHYVSHNIGRLRKNFTDIETVGSFVAASMWKGLVYSSLAIHLPNLLLNDYNQSTNTKVVGTAALVLGNVAFAGISYLSGLARGSKTMSKKEKQEVEYFIYDERSLESITEA